MWEFYHTPSRLTEKKAVAFLEEQGFLVEKVEKLGSAKHIFTHLEWDMIGYRVTLSQEKEGFSWVTASEIKEAFAIPTAFSHYRKRIQ